VSGLVEYLFNELMHLTTKAQRGYAEDSIGRDSAKARYQSGNAVLVTIDVDSLDFSGLTNDGWSESGRKTFTFRNTHDYGVHGTVTIQKIDESTFSVRPETYNNDYKPSWDPITILRNIGTELNRWDHGAGKPFIFEFDGARRFDALGRKP
jgi:hypothetical protein